MPGGGQAAPLHWNDAAAAARPYRSHPGRGPVRGEGSELGTDLALKMMSDMLWAGLLVCAPVLGITLLVGLVVSVLQVMTQVQDMSLTIVPKLVAAALVLLLFGPWMLRTLCQFAVRLWTRIPGWM